MQHRMRITDMSIDKFHAITHAIGQWHDMDLWEVPTSWIATFMGVSKPTAIKHLNRMVELGYIERIETDWRSNAKQYQWRQSTSSRMKYHKGYFKNHFNFVKAMILQVAKMSGKGKVSI